MAGDPATPLPPWGLTPQELRAEYRRTASLGATGLRFDPAVLEALHGDAHRLVCEELRRYAALGGFAPTGESRPGAGGDEAAGGGAPADAAAAALEDLRVRVLPAARRAAARLAEATGLPEPADTHRLYRAVDLLRRVGATLAVLSPEAYEADLDALVAATAGGVRRREGDPKLSWLRRRALRRQAGALVVSGRVRRAALHEMLVEASEQLTAWRAAARPDSRPGVPADGKLLAEAEAATRALVKCLDEGSALLPAKPEDTPFADLADLADRAAPAQEPAARVLDPLRRSLTGRGLGPLVAELAGRGADEETAVAAYEHCRSASILEQAGLDPTVEDGPAAGPEAAGPEGAGPEAEGAAGGGAEQTADGGTSEQAEAGEDAGTGDRQVDGGVTDGTSGAVLPQQEEPGTDAIAPAGGQERDAAEARTTAAVPAPVPSPSAEAAVPTRDERTGGQDDRPSAGNGSEAGGEESAGGRTRGAGGGAVPAGAPEDTVAAGRRTHGAAAVPAPRTAGSRVPPAGETQDAKSVAKRRTGKKSAAEKPAEKPAAAKPMAEESAAGKPAAEPAGKPAAEGRPAGEPAGDEQAAAGSAAREPVQTAGSDAVASPAEGSAARDEKRPRRPRKPSITPGRPITSYSADELVALVRWIDSDFVRRTDDELCRAAMKELGFARMGPRIREALTEAVSTVRGDES